MSAWQGAGGLAPGQSLSDDDDATGTEGLLMANGDEDTVADGLQHGRQQPLNGMQAERSRRQLSSAGAQYAGHSCEGIRGLECPQIHIAGVSRIVL